MSDPAPTGRTRAAPWLWAATTVLLVAGTGLATWHFTRSAADTAAASSAAASQPSRRLARGHDYYLHVKLIELSDKTPGGKAWDRVGDSGPDVRFTLTWRKNVIWKSTEKSDTLIGSWDLLKVDLKQVITSGGQADIEGMVNAPLVHYEPGETVTLQVWDEDTVGSDDAGTIELWLDELSPGETIVVPKGKAGKGIKRVVLALIDRRTPVPELVDLVSKR